MNERTMQFRIGMFVIVAGLVLTMLIVWFGESPALFRAVTYVTVHYSEAPGVGEGIPVRKSGIRVGEVASIRFDDRPGQSDGVLVTIALEKKYKIHAGSVPRITRALIGDVSIDLMPGAGQGLLATSSSAANAPIIEGAVAPDPSNALAAATDAFQNVKGTLDSIDSAAKGIAKLSKKAENVDEFIASIRDAARKIGTLVDGLNKVVKSSEADFPAAIAGVRQAADKFNTTFDEAARENLKVTLRQLASGTAKLDKIFSDLQPIARDLAADTNKTPTTNIGQVLVRLNRISSDVGLLTATLRTYDANGKPQLNTAGTIQKLFTTSELYDTLHDVVRGAKTFVANANRFAEKIANDPAAIGRGVLNR